MRVATIAIVVCSLPFVAACGGNPSGPSTSGTGQQNSGTEVPNPPPLTPVQAAVRDAFQREFDEPIPRPAIFSDPAATNCLGQSYLMTVAYLPTGPPTERRIHAIYMAHDGGSLVTGADGRTKYAYEIDVIPAGTFRVLTVLLLYETFPEGSVPLWRNAQAAINEQHAAFARARRYPSPVVQFVFTNVTLTGAQVPNPRSAQGIRAALEPTGTSIADYDFVVVINPDPNRSEGGFATIGLTPPHFVYVGNFGNWKALLPPEQLTSIAATAYHHEVGHHWGWQHDWTPSCGSNLPFSPFITAPALFGWEDTDGDGVPEILDSTPYGRSQ